ncbi:MAG: hypothetical protein QM808_17535 [Steroidobacteraceae bacterium]
MKRSLLAMTVAATLCMSAAFAQTAAPILPNGAAATQTQDDANKDLVMKFMRDFFNHGQMSANQAAELYLARDFQNHDPDEPSGNLAFAGFVSKRGSTAVTPEPLRLLVMTEGDLTLFVYPNKSSDDPASSFGSNLFSHKNGKLTAWWYSGPMANQGMPPGGDGMGADGMAAGGMGAEGMAAGAAPGMAAAAPTPDYSKLYKGYTASTGASVVMSTGTASITQRAANKKLVLSFINDFFVQKKSDVANKYLATSLKNHSKDQPSGSEFATYAAKNADKVTAPKTNQILFSIADGDMVAVAHPMPVNGDPGGHYALNLARVQDNKIVDWWYSGYPSEYTKTPAGGIPNGVYVPVP